MWDKCLEIAKVVPHDADVDQPQEQREKRQKARERGDLGHESGLRLPVGPRGPREPHVGAL